MHVSIARRFPNLSGLFAKKAPNVARANSNATATATAEAEFTPGRSRFAHLAGAVLHLPRKAKAEQRQPDHGWDRAMKKAMRR